LSEFLAQVIGAKEDEFMRKKIKYTEGPEGASQRVADFLPPPHQLVFREDTVKVTMTLSKASVDFFKTEARKNGTQYQKMIRQLLDAYSEAHRE
jgi:predicted DNA binding CopG/RHH family protein